MGTGWNYFNNVCEALRVAIGVLGVALGLLAVGGGWWGVSQYLQNANPESLQAAAAPADEQNSGIAPATSNAAAPTATNAAAPIAAPPARSNAVAAPAASAATTPSGAPAAKPARTGSHPDFYHQNARPNPQFSGGG